MSSNRKATLVGGGIGTLAAAAFMIRDGGMAGSDITVLDALPVVRFQWFERDCVELGVSVADDKFQWSARPAGSRLTAACGVLAAAGGGWEGGYVSEYCPRLKAFARTVARTLRPADRLSCALFDGTLRPIAEGLTDHGIAERLEALLERSSTGYGTRLDLALDWLAAHAAPQPGREARLRAKS